MNVGGGTNYRRLLTRLPLEIIAVLEGDKLSPPVSLSLFFHRTDTITNDVYWPLPADQKIF